MRIRFGLKAWSTNLAIISPAHVLYDSGDLDYIEVFCVPDSADSTTNAWAGSGIPLVIHAPHSVAGLNFSLHEAEARNSKLAEESLRMADTLRADHVIFHPGTNGTIAEAIRQIRKIRDPRMLIENKPYRGIDGSTCIGSSPGEIAEIMSALDLGFCMDFGHAIAASNSHGISAFAFIDSFIAMKPTMFHLTDGDISSEIDNHAQYGEGTFPLYELLALVPDGACVTNEARRENQNSAEEYLRDRKLAMAMMISGTP